MQVHVHCECGCQLEARLQFADSEKYARVNIKELIEEQAREEFKRDAVKRHGHSAQFNKLFVDFS